MKIKTVLYPLLLLLVALVCLPSCIKDEEETVSTDEHCFISSFSIGTLKRIVNTTTAEGKDSSYTISFSGAYYPMTIDQRNMVIENKDSLPYGTKVSAALATIGYTGLIGYKTKDDDTYTAYNKTDSIDFSNPLKFTVFSNTGKSERTYTVKLNVHKQDGNQTVWNQFTNNDELEAMAQRSMVAGAEGLYMLGTDAEGKVLCAKHSGEITDNWTISSTIGTDKADINTLKCIAGGSLIMSTTEGALLISDNGTEWSELATAVSGRRLIGCSTNYIYALTNGTIQSSADGGLTWTDEALDEDASLLPDGAMSMVRCEQSNGYDRMVLIGNCSQTTDLKAEVWSKGWRSAVEEPTAKWMYYPHTADNKRLCPQMSAYHTFAYDNGMITVTSNAVDGTYKMLQSILYSQDYGLSWRPSYELMLPTSLCGTTQPVAVTVDKDNFIWIVAGNETWRGRLNRLGFKK